MRSLRPSAAFCVVVTLILVHFLLLVAPQDELEAEREDMTSSDESLMKWSVRQLKEEMTTKFGKTDFTGCFEKVDLVNLLQQLRASQPTATSAASSNVQEPPQTVGGLTYGRTLYIGNTRRPTSAVILSHGLGDTGEGWEDAATMMSSEMPNTIFVLPTAPVQSVTFNMGARMNSWYDIRSLNVGASEDLDGIYASAKRLHSMMGYVCAKYNIPHSTKSMPPKNSKAAMDKAAKEKMILQKRLRMEEEDEEGDDEEGLTLSNVAKDVHRAPELRGRGDISFADKKVRLFAEGERRLVRAAGGPAVRRLRGPADVHSRSRSGAGAESALRCAPSAISTGASAKAAALD